MSSSIATAPDADEAPEPVTPAGLIGAARDARVRREQAEYDVLTVAIEWATSHEVLGPVTRERSGAAGAPGDFPEGGPVEDLDGVPDALLSALERAARKAAPETSQPATEPAPEPAGPVGTRVDSSVFEEAEARRRWRGLPDLQWDCAAPLAAALGLTTRAGWVLLRQGLTLRHRLPRTYGWWRHGEVETRVARMVADKVVGQPDDVCAWVDAKLAARIRSHREVVKVSV